MSKKVNKKPTKPKLDIDYNTKMSEYENAYKVDLNVPGDTKFGDYLKQIGYPSLSQMLKSR